MDDYDTTKYPIQRTQAMTPEQAAKYYPRQKPFTDRDLTTKKEEGGYRRRRVSRRRVSRRRVSRRRGSRRHRR
jgi:hypothetical protein